jgi:hypothetical protein
MWLFITFYYSLGWVSLLMYLLMMSKDDALFNSFYSDESV